MSTSFADMGDCYKWSLLLLVLYMTEGKMNFTKQ